MIRLAICFLAPLLLGLAYTIPAYSQAGRPLRVGVAGLTHTHVHWLFNSAKEGDIEIAGIAEADTSLAGRYARQYGIAANKIYPHLDALLDAEKPEAVVAFNAISEHLEVVQRCAPKGIHVMVEKPLAVSLDQARQMEALARQHKILLLTNYETTWYSSVHEAYRMVNDSAAAGPIRKIVVHDGHKGPREIGVNKEFLDWLTDPKKNGAGALTDFGCYGADLSTWLMKGQKPISVTAITQQIKPDVYPQVDDEATIILTYPAAQTIIQASWNWPFPRKDMEVYLQAGSVVAKNGSQLFYRFNESQRESLVMLPARKPPFHDPFSYFKAVVRGTVKPGDNDLSSLPLNMTVMEILEAARQSAKEGKTILLAGDR
ncbi:MAG TPA: Gfo/Idh/MocA family oxidoreductase [Flavisolibacter sp.]|nr:Gfo/Idh/MocA family oxidoreductase [Flavisolibacter sp.]